MRTLSAANVKMSGGPSKMRIAQVSPLYESCPPRLYGGTERVVSYLTEELVRQGHEVNCSPAATPTLQQRCGRRATRH